jgi:hypothetical protein
MRCINGTLSLLNRSIKTKGPVNNLMKQKKNHMKVEITNSSDVTVIQTTGLEFLMKRDLEIEIKHTGMSLSMVLGIPAIDTFRPRRLTSCTITKICSECLAPILKRCQE